MKKIICVLLSIIIALSGLVFQSFAKDSLNFTICSDTHYQSKKNQGNLIDEKANAYSDGMKNADMYYYATVQGQMNFESGAILSEFFDEFIQSDNNILLISGDLTCGKLASHLEFADMLKKVEESGKEVFVINGNHDTLLKDSENRTTDPDGKINISQFKEIYADFGYNQALSVEKTSASYTAKLNDDYRLLAIDSNIYGEDDGQLTKNVLSFIKQEVAKAKDDGVELITMMHHSILPHYLIQPMMKNYEKHAATLAGLDITNVFTGHIHANDISVSETKSGDLYDIQTGSLIAYPNAYREISYSDKKIDITSKYITKIDMSLLPDGYTEQQLYLLENDFSTYSHNFFTAGVCRWINRYLGSAWKVAKFLKIKEGTKLYSFIDDVMSNIGDALTLDIYDNGTKEIDSLEDVAKIAGYKIPESEYTKLYEPAAEIMAGFFKGDENSEAELNLFLPCLKAALTKTISNMSLSRKALALFASQLGINADIISVKGLTVLDLSDTIAEKLLICFFRPLLDGFVSDLSSPSDINLTIPTEKSTTVKLNFFQKIKAFFERILFFIKNI